MCIVRKSFKRLHYPIEVIRVCLRWYLACSLSLRNLEEMMQERGIFVDHSTLHRWMRWYLSYSLSLRNLEKMMAERSITVDHSTVFIRLTPLLDKTFRRYKHSVGRRWRMDETYIRVKGQWKYLYRAVGSSGQTVDFLLTASRDAAAALRFFRRAFRRNGAPEVVTIDNSTASKSALTTLSTDRAEEETFTIRQNRYLNNLVEQDQRNIKRRIKLMAGFKSFRRAQSILAGIELIHMLRKGQYQHPRGDGMSPAEPFYLSAA